MRDGPLRGSGYDRVAIELSPIVAQDIEAAARHNGLQGIADFFAVPDTWSPMYLREEARFIAAVVNAAPRGGRVLWGFDRELFSGRHLIARLEARVPRRNLAARLREERARTSPPKVLMKFGYNHMIRGAKRVRRRRE